MPVCKNCGQRFPNRIRIDGRVRRLSSRSFCLKCSKLDGRNRRPYIVQVPEGMAFCARCQKMKQRNLFHSRKNGKPLSYCKNCQNETKILKWEEKMEKVVASKGGVCADCGMVYPTPVFRFIKNGKPYPLSRSKNMSWERILEALAGHEMLCLNCEAMRAWQEKG